MLPLKRFNIRLGFSVFVSLLPPGTLGKVQTLRQCSLSVDSAVKAVSHSPGAFVFDIVS